MLGDGRHDVVLRGVAELDEGVLDFGAGLLRKGFGFIELIGPEDAALDQDVGEIATGFAHWKGSPSSSYSD